MGFCKSGDRFSLSQDKVSVVFSMALPLILVLCEYENAFSCADSDFLVIDFMRGKPYV